MKALYSISTVFFLAAFLMSCQETTAPASSEMAVLNLNSKQFLTATSIPGAIVNGTTLQLTANYTTTETITIPDGYTLDGRGYTITAEDPGGGHFTGAVVTNAGSSAYVKDLTVTAYQLTNACDAGGNRLRGIMFEGASGAITHCTVIGINQGPSGCQEGNAIEVRNAPFDGSHPNTQTVEIAHNNIQDYQKGGIICNGDVNVNIHHNAVGASATQQNLAANSIQLGFGAIGEVKHNRIDGNQWLGASNYVATAILLYLPSDGSVVSLNNISGNSDVGLYAYGENGTYWNNRIFDEGVDGPHGDYGIVNFGSGNNYNNNKIRGFDEPIYGADVGNNKVIPKPHN